MDVLGDKTDWLNFESIDTEYQGFEFATGHGKVTKWHQTKVNAPSGNWTIRALERAGVLKTFLNRLSTDNHAKCYFVSQDSAKDFETLTDKARMAASFEQYWEELSIRQKDHFEQIKKAWQEADELTFEMLARSYVEVYPNRQLDSLIHTYGDFYFQGGGNQAFPILRDILEKNFNRTLTTEAARDAVKSEGTLKIKEWALDPTLPQRLEEETEVYLQTYTPFGAGGETIPREQTSFLIEELLSPDGPELLLVTGVAGSGKSGVVRTAIERLQSQGIPHLAFRVDQHLSCNTREELGRRLTGRRESPVSTLKGTFPTTPSVLFIDQVDAVSEVSGRDGRVKEVVLRLISDAHNFGGVKVVVACRTFDLDSDPRLKSLKKAHRTKQIDVKLLDWKAEVAPLLKTKGVDVSLFNQPQRQLLRLPVNLTVFLEINEPEFFFRSRSNLHEKLIEKKRRKISKERNLSWSLIQPLTAMCEWMSQRQKLSAPASVLDNYANAVDILTSEGLIVSSRGKINFFHESFFDHIYARAFINSDKSLNDLLLSTEQHLFRRTQARQILEALRQSETNRYYRELSTVLSSNDIRFHIKAAICQWLSTIEAPTEQEFKIISRFDEQNGKFHQFFRRAVLSTPAWFDFLNKKGWIQQQLNGRNQDRTETVLWWLSNIAGERPVETARLLRSWWGDDGKRAARLLNWFGYVNSNQSNDELLQLCEDVIGSHPEGLFQNQGRDRIGMLLHTWSQASPSSCGRILQALFEAWFELNPDGTPFEREELELFGIHSLDKLVKETPQTFLEGTTDGLLQSVDRVVSEGSTSINWYEFKRRTYSGNARGFDQFLGMYRSALKRLAEEALNEATGYLDRVSLGKHSCLMHLHLETIQANPKALGDRLPELLADDMVFEAGWNGADWYSFAHACRKAIPYLGSAERKLVEKAILEYRPEIDAASRNLRDIIQKGENESYWKKSDIVPRLLNWSGYRQWCILETIGEELLSPAARIQLSELRRKFPDKEVAKPTHVEAGFVASPIQREHCDRMQDRHWLSAIKLYDGKNNKGQRRDFFKGGARELAAELQEATKKDPSRFSALSLQIPDSAPPVYLENILWGLADAESPSHDSLVHAVARAHQHPERPFGGGIARLVNKHPGVASNPEVFKIVIWYALNGDADDNVGLNGQNAQSETLTINTLIRRGGTFYARGINSVRGMAWEALASVLWEIQEVENQIWEVLEVALEREPQISVRCCMMNSLVPLFNSDKERFCTSILKLIALPKDAPLQNEASRLAPLITHTGVRLFEYIFNQLPELADELVTKLLQCRDENTELIGAWLVFRQSFHNEDFIDRADRLATKSLNHRRLLAGVAAGATKWAENRHRADVLLKKFFFDEDEQVRGHATKAFSEVSAEEAESYQELAAKFLKSPAFPENPLPVLYMLEEATFDVLELVVEATQRLITDITEKGDKYGRHSTYTLKLQELLRREYSSSESNVKAREKILHLIDLMLLHQIYGVDKIVSTHDRW